MAADLMLWVKALHVISVVAWLVALLYLPRLMVYHAGTAPGSESSELFKVMERRLLVAIATPAMIATWVFGVSLAWLIRPWGEGWFWAKLACVLALTFFHKLAAGWVRTFGSDTNRRPARFYRAVNEIPTILLVAIVVLAIVKPF